MSGELAGSSLAAAEAAKVSDRGAPDVIAPPPLIYLGGLAVGFGMQALLPAPSPPRVLTLPVGTALTVAGAGLARSFLQAFSRAGTPVSPYRSSERLVTSGPYRFTRNPGYLGMALVYTGITMLSRSPWALVPLPLVLLAVDRGVIAREERYLRGRFGEDYERYERGTRRWL